MFTKSARRVRIVFSVLLLVLLMPTLVMAGDWPLLRKGNSGRNVTTAQYLLRYRGYSLTVNGSFDTTTEARVKSFQTANGLISDGIIGDNTWSKLIATAQQGSKGDHVRAIQDQLRNRYGCSLTIDGDFGSGTRSAVIAYQRANGLGADGVVGGNTWKQLVNGYEGLTHANAANQLANNGIPVSSSGGCSNRCNSTCTSFHGARQSTITGIINFKKSSGCAITATGGTETGHSAGTYSHWNGYKIDIGVSSCINNYIYRNFTAIGGNKYRDANGNIYYYESNHWDILYYK